MFWQEKKNAAAYTSDIVELNNPIPDLPADRMQTMREDHQHFTRNKMMTPQTKLPAFLKPVRQSSVSPKAKLLKRDKQQVDKLN